MSYSCLEELQVAFDLSIDKIDVLSNAGCKYQRNNWLIVTDDGICHLFDKDGNLDDIKKIKQLKEKYIRKDITKIVILNSVTNIREEAFEYCSSLTSMTIPDSVTNIGEAAFYGCSGLREVTIGNGVKSIGYYTFYGCYKLTSLIFKCKTLEQVKKMKYYPWGIKDKSIISVE